MPGINSFVNITIFIKKGTLFFFGILVCVGLMGGCATTRVKRINVDKTVDLSGRWNDTDSRLVAEKMVKDALSRPWVDNFARKHINSPKIIVGTVLNRTHEHINVQTFIKDLERELTNSGKVQFVASSSERGEIREERMDQQKHSSEETAKGLGKEYAADFMLKGTINSILDERGNKKITFYQVTLEIIDIENNIKVWLGDKKIKKQIKRSRFGL